MGQLTKDPSGFLGALTQSEKTKTYTMTTANQYVDRNIALSIEVAHENLTEDNIKKDVSMFGVTGTLDYIKHVESVPGIKDTSVIYDTTTGKYYLWKE